MLPPPHPPSRSSLGLTHAPAAPAVLLFCGALASVAHHFPGVRRDTRMRMPCSAILSGLSGDDPGSVSPVRRRACEAASTGRVPVTGRSLGCGGHHDLPQPHLPADWRHPRPCAEAGTTVEPRAFAHPLESSAAATASRCGHRARLSLQWGWGQAPVRRGE